MQQGFVQGCDIEVSALEPEQDVIGEKSGGDNLPAQVRKFLGRQHEPADTPYRNQDQCQSWENASRPLGVESQDTEATRLDVLQEVPADQIAGNHEEYIDAYETARERVRK